MLSAVFGKLNIQSVDVERLLDSVLLNYMYGLDFKQSPPI